MNNKRAEILSYIKRMDSHMTLMEAEIYKEEIAETLFEIKEYRPNTADWEYIGANKKQIWDFLNNGYIKVGYEKFCGCDNPRSLFKNANLIKIAFFNGVWVAISVYTGYRSGYKNVGITAIVDEKLRKTGVAAVHDIIKTDIGNFEQFYWTECSGTIDVLYEKYNGIKIPNSYAFAIVQSEVKPDEDGYHYQREIKGEMQTKIIYGFNNKDTFEKVKSEREEYINNCIQKILSHKIDESVESPSFGKYGEVDCALGVINFFVDQRWEGECYEFPETSFVILRQYVKMLEKYMMEGLVSREKIEQVKQAVENGNDILETSMPMQIFTL